MRIASVLSSRQEAIDAAARAWLAKLHSGEASDADGAAFRSWLAEASAHREAFRSLDALWRSLDLVDDVEASVRRAGGTTAEWSAALLRAPRWRNAGLAAAACCLAVVGGALFVRLYDPVQHSVHATGVAESRAVALPDGTQVTLRPETEIRTVFSGTRRSVEIAQGGAYFDVARDEHLAFQVETADTQVSVLGTAFDVLVGPRSVDVSVTEGVVRVVDLSPREGATDLRGEVTLGAGERVAAGFDGALGAVERFDPQEAGDWREGRLSYANARLEDIVFDANRYREVKIEIAAAELSELRVTTAFRVENSDQMLASLEASGQVRIVRTPAAIRLYRP